MNDRRVAVLLFPGMNCENESVRALASVGVNSVIIRSNEPAERLASFDGYLLPGGFSYEDRIRAGVVAANDRAMGVVARAAEAGKPVAGICNGAQVLLETGLVPGIRPGRIEMALALNDSGTRVGYYCDWRWVRGELFPDAVPLPFAHAEGRFVSADESVRHEILQRGLTCARYCRPDGEVVPGWPVNPNGAWENAAAMRNPEGNVVAIMPHPERANWAWQVPREVGGDWVRAKSSDAFLDAPGPGRVFFETFAELLRRAAA
jgi:phosphoribosylformylglycinamidine synthase